jgi:hypothetical protein
LNPAYFNDAQLTKGLLSLRQRVAAGGCLALCRTESGGGRDGNNASIFKLGPDGKFGVVARLRGGSELEDRALTLPAP